MSMTIMAMTQDIEIPAFEVVIEPYPLLKTYASVSRQAVIFCEKADVIFML